MKVRNIVFSGFAAAILMGTVDANAAFTIASKDYVDSKVSTGLVDESTGKEISVAEALATKADADALGEGIGTGNGEKTVAEALAEKADADALGGAFNENNTVADAIDAKADASDVGTVSDITGYENGDTIVSTINDMKTDISGKQDALGGASDAGKVVTATATAGTVEYTAIDSTIGTQGTNNLITSAAVKAYVDDAIDGVSGSTGSIATQIQNALGNLGAGNTTVEDALADKADKTDVTALETKVGTDELASDFTATDVVGAINELNTEKQNKLSEDQLKAVNSGIDATKVAAYEATQTAMSGSCTSESDYCVLVKNKDSGAMEWAGITLPFSMSVEP